MILSLTSSVACSNGKLLGLAWDALALVTLRLAEVIQRCWRATVRTVICWRCRYAIDLGNLWGAKTDDNFLLNLVNSIKPSSRAKSNKGTWGYTRSMVESQVNRAWQSDAFLREDRILSPKLKQHWVFWQLMFCMWPIWCQTSDLESLFWSTPPVWVASSCEGTLCLAELVPKMFRPPFQANINDLSEFIPIPCQHDLKQPQPPTPASTQEVTCSKFVFG